MTPDDVAPPGRLDSGPEPDPPAVAMNHRRSRSQWLLLGLAALVGVGAGTGFGLSMVSRARGGGPGAPRITAAAPGSLPPPGSQGPGSQSGGSLVPGPPALASAAASPGSNPVATPAASSSLSTARPADYVAPGLAGPLRNLDPSLPTRGPRPTLSRLAGFQLGLPSLLFNPRGGPDDWRLVHPSLTGVRGYAGAVSVTAGSVVPLHLSGVDQSARLDVFRIGRGDAVHLIAIRGVAISSQPEATARAEDGLLAEAWPVSYRLQVPVAWTSGFYLVKLTGSSGRDSYVPFIVRPRTAQPLLIVLPSMTYQAYNAYGGPSLYTWYHGPRPRAYAVSFDRPYADGYGAGLFMRLDLPLVIWLEDHGYQPAYVADIDVARDPSLVTGARTVIFSGHGEYWTGSMRDVVDAASRNGTSFGFFGANQAFWQVRLEAAADRTANRVVRAYKSASLDPVAASDPRSTTTRFQQAPVNRPPATLMGVAYGGIVNGGLQPWAVGPGITRFAPDVGLKPGQRLPGLIGGEVDVAPAGFSGLMLGATAVDLRGHARPLIAATTVWINPAGGRIFDAGTFNYAWGLDPRYAAALPGFPAEPFSRMTASILAWLGAQPTR